MLSSSIRSTRSFPSPKTPYDRRRSASASLLWFAALSMASLLAVALAALTLRA